MLLSVSFLLAIGLVVAGCAPAVAPEITELETPPEVY